MPNVLAYAETRGNDLRKVALETVAAARALADSMGGEVHALVTGGPGAAVHAATLGAHGADVVYVAEDPSLARYNPEPVTALCAGRAGTGYAALLVGASARGRDIAPRIAARLGSAMLSDVTSLRHESNAFVASHPMYAGKVLATLRLTNSGSVAVISLRPGAFSAVPAARAGRLERVPLGDPNATRLQVSETAAGDSRKLDLAEAPVIVSGGRGLKAPANFKLVEDLAAAFGNAAVGATRAVTDDGWRPHSDQIGQTGRQVSPELYVAVGISGAIQHIAGMRSARCIVAINKDPEAPIFKVADYGVVGDVFEVVPALTDAIRAARAHR
jgi:electron transfer flavoprotein alpha subunit